jgi:hypothetical protein
MQMALRTLSVGELRSPNSTPRHHSKKQRTKARALFAEQGIVVPIIVDDRMRIIDGVLRFETAKELGLDELNAVVVSNSTDAQLLQLELSLNRLAEDSAWNAEHLKTKFEQLIEYQVDLTFTGFETASTSKDSRASTSVDTRPGTNAANFAPIATVNVSQRAAALSALPRAVSISPEIRSCASGLLRAARTKDGLVVQS